MCQQQRAKPFVQMRELNVQFSQRWSSFQLHSRQQPIPLRASKWSQRFPMSFQKAEQGVPSFASSDVQAHLLRARFCQSEIPFAMNRQFRAPLELQHLLKSIAPRLRQSTHHQVADHARRCEAPLRRRMPCGEVPDEQLRSLT